MTHMAPSYPALEAWRAELAAGKRDRYTFDPLWRAACEEMNAIEAPTPMIAATCQREAARIIKAAALKAAS